MDHLSQGVTIAIFATFFLLIVAVGFISLFLFQQKRQMETRLQAQEDVLKKISQEIHDNIGQILTLAKLNLTTLNLKNLPESEEKIRDTRTLLTTSLRDLRSLSRLLNTDFVTSQGLIESIEDEIRNIKKSVTLSITFTIQGEPYVIPPQQELRLFRIFQEAMANTLKHAQATVVNVLLSFGTTELLLQVIDNGRGFDSTATAGHHPAKKPAGKGIGIRNMTDRADQMGAQIAVQSKTGEGTTVSVRLPAGKLSRNKQPAS